MLNNKLLTIFTPTYNRRASLISCYESLIKQTTHNFLWQIIDDGSTDDTESLVRGWISDALIEISYLKIENSGKASAINRSVSQTNTTLWMCLDSDDFLIPDAVEKILEEYESISSDATICGFFSVRASADKMPMRGKNIPSSCIFVTQAYVRYKLGIPPEYSHVFKTEVIKKYKYPVIENENYFPLSYVFDQIDQKYKYKVIHQPYMVCTYLDDGITKNKRDLIIKNPVGYKLYKRQLIELAPGVWQKYKAASTYITACLLAKEVRIISNSGSPFLALLAFPTGLLDYLLRYKLRLRLDLE